MLLTGAMHVHSTYSDGEFTLADLRRVFLAEGCSFLCTTDHAEYFNAESIQRYRDECASLSDDQFRFVAGLEYRCDQNMHILGYGATQLSLSTDPQEIFRHIDSQGAVSVIAHPKDEHFPWIESFSTLPQGIETWNTKYDGRYAPRARTFALLQRLRQRSPQMHAFYGQDLHWKKQYRGMWINLETTSAEPSAIVAALAAGNYSAQKDAMRLPSTGILPQPMLENFDRAHARSQQMWSVIKSSKQVLERLGIKVPDSLKSRLRRIF